MSKLYTGKIDVSKIDKTKIFEGKKGSYLNLDIWVNDEADLYGNEIAIRQQTGQTEENIYLGNAKEFNLKKQV